MYIRGFDGLRAVALLSVFLTHKTEWGEKSQVGFAGVWLFFLLSGFLITGQLCAARARIEARQAGLRKELIAFWIKRAFRIFPAYYVLLMLVVPFHLFTHRDVPGLPYYTTYLSNFFFQSEPKQFSTTFAHLWSLAVEEQYYILFAPLLLLVPSRLAGSACALVIVGSLLRRFWMAHLDIPAFEVYIDSFVNFGILAFGGLLYVRRATVANLLRTAHLDRALAGCVAMVLLLACPPIARRLAGSNLPLLQINYVSGVFAGALLLINVYFDQNSALVRILEWRPIAHLGRISYGLYLYNDYVKNDLPQRILSSLLRTLHAQRSLSWTSEMSQHVAWAQTLFEIFGLAVCFVVVFVTAQLSWMFVEKPALRMRDRFLSDKVSRISRSIMLGDHSNLDARPSPPLVDKKVLCNIDI